MSDNSEANSYSRCTHTVLHNQHAISAAIEEVTKCLSKNGVRSVAANAIAAMETLDRNAEDITGAIMRLRQL
ncbi:hypothetical protein ABHN08_25590 [Pseudomonas atacamensis]|uniref:Uncharacterized protein n=1 Tax=Pseudomonas iranensis TaxID=2745503 RepID=A0AAU7EUI1_9PSED